MDAFLAPSQIGGGAYLAPALAPSVSTVNAVIGWVEASELHQMSASVSAPVIAIAAGWVEESEVVQIVASPGIALYAGWTEASEAWEITIVLDAPEYARAPDGGGFQPQRCGRQNRPPAFQGYCK